MEKSRFGYCPQPVTVCTLGAILRAIYDFFLKITQLVQSGGSTQVYRTSSFEKGVHRRVILAVHLGT